MNYEPIGSCDGCRSGHLSLCFADIDSILKICNHFCYDHFLLHESIWLEILSTVRGVPRSVASVAAGEIDRPIGCPDRCSAALGSTVNFVPQSDVRTSKGG